MSFYLVDELFYRDTQLVLIYTLEGNQDAGRKQLLLAFHELGSDGV
jgi:hypothetical protein